MTYNYLVGKQANGYLPLIPQNKLRINFGYNITNLKPFNSIKFSVKYTYAFAQNKISAYETASPAYDLLDAQIELSNKIGKQKIYWSAGCYNILNKKYTDHLSTLKDVGFYDMGRNFTFSLKIPFSFNLHNEK